VLPCDEPNPASRALVVLGAVLLVAATPRSLYPVLQLPGRRAGLVLLRRFEGERDPRGACAAGSGTASSPRAPRCTGLVVALWHFTPLSALGYLATIALFGLWYALLFWLVIRVRLRLPWCRLRSCFRSHGRRSSGPWAIREIFGSPGSDRTSLTDASVLGAVGRPGGRAGVTLCSSGHVMIVKAIHGSGEQGGGGAVSAAGDRSPR